MTAPRTPPLLEATELGRRSPGGGDAWLLRDVSLRLDPGDRLGLFGPSGSGKTLLLRALAMLDPIDAGRVLWRGEAVAPADVPGFRGRAVLVPQRPPAGAGTVADALREPFAFATHAERRFDADRAHELLGELGRGTDFTAKRQRELSGGEAQLVALVRALLLEPEALLLDEPTAALDAATSDDAERLLAAWADDHPERAWIWITHDSAQLDRTCTDRLRLAHGRVVEE